MTPTDKRVKDLIDSWLTSLDLHLQYAELNDSAYNKVQPWPVHDRPSKWVLEMSRQKVVELQSALEWRIAMGDTNFAETLEQAISLANLVGVQNLKRFVPLALPERHGKAMLSDVDDLAPVFAPRIPAHTVPTPAPQPPVQPVAKSAAPTPPPAPRPVVSPPTPAIPVVAPKPAAVASAPQAITPAPVRTAASPSQPSALATPPPARPTAPPTAAAAPPAKPAAPVHDTDATREMPRLQRIPTPPPVQAAKAAPVAAPKAPPPPPPAPKAPESDGKTVQMVMEDAVRLIAWGRPWHELPEAVARLADRPRAAEVRRILREHRKAIEQRAKDEAEAAQDKKKKKKR